MGTTITMKNVDQDLARVLKFMQDHALKLSRRSKEFLSKQFPSLRDEIDTTAQDEKENSQPQANRHHDKKD